MRFLCLVAVAFLSMTSCMDFNLEMNMKADGSADAQVQLEMLDQLYGNLRTMAAAAGYDLSMLEKEGAEQFFSDHKGRLDSYSNQVEQGVRSIKMSVSTDDGIAWINSIAPQQMRVDPLENPSGSYQLRLLDGELGQSFGNMDQASLEQYLASLRPMMTGFYAELAFHFPKVVETNMTKSSDQKVSYVLDFDQDLAGLTGNQAVTEVKRLLSPKTVTFSGVTRP
jgi:hypothetical protein